MFVQIVFKYAGAAWQTFGPVVAASDAQDAYETCRKYHPTAMVGRVEGFSLADIEGKLDLVHGVGEATREEGPRDVPLLEAGPGGDHDMPYTYTPPNDGTVTAKWVRLLGKFQRGELGGPNDGGEDESGALVA